MAIIKMDPKYQEMSDEFVRAFKEKDILLSDYAEGLVRLSVEAWYEDTPRSIFRNGNDIEMKKLAEKILEKTLEEDHLTKFKKARYSDMIWAIASSGKNVLKKLFDKGL